MNQEFPAGGPPHSGKSVLIYSLTRALREARISHYVLRACPDGEGDWSYQAPQDLVRAIRVKGAFTPEFTQRVIGYLQQRPLPLLVDVGGKPTSEQEQIFAHCTHAILLIGDRADDPDAFERDLQEWQAMIGRNQVPILGVFRSDLQETERLQAAGQEAEFQTLPALERGKEIYGPVFEEVIDHLSALMFFAERSLSAIHKRQLPAGVHFLDLPHLAGQQGNQERHWQPEDLPFLLDQIPANQPIAVYGRSANWVYAALALAAAPHPFMMFDAKLGWVTPPTLPWQTSNTEEADWQTQLIPQGDFLLLEMSTGSQYLDIDEPERIPLPPLPLHKGVILSGRIPHWLLTAVCRQLAPTQPWLAVYQPPLGAAVVVFSRSEAYRVGQCMPHVPAARQRE